MNEMQEKIIKAAFALFKEKGYQATTTREIAAKAGIKKGLLYYYFKKKEDIVFTWYKAFLNEIYAHIHCEDALLRVTVFLFVYYDVLAADAFALTLIDCVLSHHELTKRKVIYTTEFYASVLKDYDDQRILILNASMIGGESQLLPMIIHGEIDMTVKQFRDLFIHRFLSFLEVSDDYFGQAENISRQFNKDDFKDFMNLK